MDRKADITTVLRCTIRLLSGQFLRRNTLTFPDMGHKATSFLLLFCLGQFPSKQRNTSISTIPSQIRLS